MSTTSTINWGDDMPYDDNGFGADYNCSGYNGYDGYDGDGDDAKAKEERAEERAFEEAEQDRLRIQHAKESHERLLAQPRKVLVEVQQPYKTRAQFGISCDKNGYPLDGSARLNIHPNGTY